MSSNSVEIEDKAAAISEGTKTSSFNTEDILKKTGVSAMPLDFTNTKKNYMPGYEIVGQKVSILDENKMIMKGDKGATSNGKDDVLPKDMDKLLKE